MNPRKELSIPLCESDLYIFQIDLWFVRHVMGLITQGDASQLADNVITTFKLYYGVDESTLIAYAEDGINIKVSSKLFYKYTSILFFVANLIIKYINSYWNMSNEALHNRIPIAGVKILFLVTFIIVNFFLFNIVLLTFLNRVNSMERNDFS